MPTEYTARRDEVVEPSERTTQRLPDDCRILVCDFSAGYGFIRNDGGWNIITCNKGRRGLKTTPVPGGVPVKLTDGYPIYLDGPMYTRIIDRGLRSRGYNARSQSVPDLVSPQLREGCDLLITGSEIIDPSYQPTSLPAGYDGSNPSDLAAFFIRSVLQQDPTLQVIVGKTPTLREDLANPLPKPSSRLEEVMSDQRIHIMGKPFDVPENPGRDRQGDHVEFLQLVRKLLGVQYRPIESIQ